MTTSKITQIASMLNNPDLLQMQKQSQVTDVAFGSFLNYTASSGGSTANLFSGVNADKSAKPDAVNQTAFEKESVKSSYRESSISRSENADGNSKLPEDAKDKLEVFGEQIKETVAEELGISQEELTQQMEALGLTVLDLMDPSKLAGLVMELTGSEDIGGLLLSENFQQLLGEISELSQNFAQQMNLTPEEMKQILPELEKMMAEQAPETVTENVGDAGAELPDSVIEETVSEAGEQSAETLNSTVQSTAEETGIHREVSQEVSDTSREEQTAEISTRSLEGEQGAEEDASDTSGGTEEDSYSKLTQDIKGNDKTDNRQPHVTYQTTTQTVNQGQTIEVTQTVVQTKVNVDDILRQVSQMTRVIVNQAESSIEMQLNPANLGKVYLQVISREGVITAQLAAQNEAVKEALESQLVVLKENMNQQGMKVEAIEVTIASHEFERNLEENQRNNAQEQEEESRRSGRRDLNVDSLDELEGLMTEEESLAAKIMTEQGNRMDVTI